jgi:hypothetical protein
VYAIPDGNSGTSTTMVPGCPGRTLPVDVKVLEPEYVEVIVAKDGSCWGTCTKTVPVWPGKLGFAIVAVERTEPRYVVVIVTNSRVGWGI